MRVQNKMAFKFYIDILEETNEEPDTLIRIAERLNLEERLVKEMLEELKKFSLVYKEDSIWSITYKGNKILENLKKEDK